MVSIICEIMNNKGEICIGMAGSGRAAERHFNALKRYTGIPVCYKHIISRRAEPVKRFKAKYGFVHDSLQFDDLLNDPEIDVVDICTPPYLHEEMIIKALNAGKHVICEKPLSGYFGKQDDKKPIGDYVSKKKMYEEVVKALDILQSTSFFEAIQSFV